MTHPISSLGIAHTVISLVPMVAGIAAFARRGAIDVSKFDGKVYLASLALSVVTSFGLSSTGGFNAGHALGIVALVVSFGTLLLPSMRWLGRARPYLTVLGLSFSFFLLLVPGINETLTRLPASAPIASGIDSPVVQGALKAWVAIFVIGVAVQCWALRKRRAIIRS
ncbi:hypothetical protein BH09PSE6_BH09PSE6_06660 [soil metagenome]